MEPATMPVGDDKMFRIGEFSRLTQVSIRMLRYYDEVGLLEPAMVDGWKGHRLYSADQIPRLNRILYLRDSGFNVGEIAHALTMDERSLLALLDKKRMEVENAIRADNEKIRKIELAKKDLQGGKGGLHYDIVVKSIPAYQVLSLRRVVTTYYCEGDMWRELSAFAAERKVGISSNTFSIYHDREFKETDVDIELCAPVEGMCEAQAPFRFRMTEPVPHMACTMVYGDFSNIRAAYLAFAEWLQVNSGYRMAYTMRQIVHRGPWNEDDPNRYLVELQIPLECTAWSPCL